MLKVTTLVALCQNRKAAQVRSLLESNDRVMARSTSKKGGGTSRHKARGGSQSRSRRKGSGASGGGSGRRSTRSLRKRPTHTGARKTSVHAPKQAHDKRFPRPRR